jgi:hypothetical protein
MQTNLALPQVVSHFLLSPKMALPRLFVKWRFGDHLWWLDSLWLGWSGVEINEPEKVFFVKP